MSVISNNILEKRRYFNTRGTLEVTPIIRYDRERACILKPTSSLLHWLNHGFLIPLNTEFPSTVSFPKTDAWFWTTRLKYSKNPTRQTSKSLQTYFTLFHILPLLTTNDSTFRKLLQVSNMNDSWDANIKETFLYKWILTLCNITKLKNLYFLICAKASQQRSTTIIIKHLLLPKSIVQRGSKSLEIFEARTREWGLSRCQRNDRMRVFTILRPRDRRPRWQLADSSILGKAEREREREDDQW